MTRQEENPLTELLSPKGGLLYLVLTAREPSIKPLADVVRCYICCDGQHKSGNTRHFSHLPSRINGRARPQTHYTTRFAKKIQETMPPAKASPLGRGGTDGDGEGKPGRKEPLRSDGQALCQSDAIAVPELFGSGLALSVSSQAPRQGRVAAPSVCFAAARILLAAAPTAPPCFRHWRRSSPLPQRGSHWHVGQLSSGRAKHNISETAVLRCLGQRQLDKERCPEAAVPVSKARPLASCRASGVQ